METTTLSGGVFLIKLYDFIKKEYYIAELEAQLRHQGRAEVSLYPYFEEGIPILILDKNVRFLSRRHRLMALPNM